jgi:hypothetical protein
VAKRPAWLWPVLVGLVATIPALKVGFTNDDLIHRLWLEGRIPEVRPSVWSLYDFSGAGLSFRQLRDLGSFPWFAHESLSLRFLRPLASASLALDHLLFGRQAILAHLQSFIWFGMLVGLASVLYARWFSGSEGRLAALLYAIAGVHGMPTAWLAARHTLLAAVSGLAALWAWARWREDRWQPGRVLAPVACLLGLLESESALAGLFLLVMYELGTGRDWRARLAGSAKFVGIGILYVWGYTTLGYGVTGSSMYVSPLNAPGQYLAVALTRVPVAFCEVFGGIPSILDGAAPRTRPFLVTWGLLTVALSGATLWSWRARMARAQRVAVVWLGVSAVLSPLLLVETMVSGRVLLLPLFGAAAVVAQILVLAWELVRRGAGLRRWSAVGLLGLFGIAHLGISPTMRVMLPLALGRFGNRLQEMAEQADLATCTSGGVVYLLTGADPGLSLYLAPALVFYTPHKAQAKALRVLSMAPHDQRLTRVGPRALELAVSGEPRRSTDFERLYRPRSSPLTPGQSCGMEGLRAEVIAARDGLANVVRFDFDRPLEAPSLCFAAWREGRVSSVRVPSAGQSILLPHEPGPFGM